MKTIYLGVWVLILLVMLSSCSPRVIKEKTLESEILCHLEVAKDTFPIGEDITVKLIIKNTSSQDVFIDKTQYGFYLDDAGNVDVPFDVRVYTEDGYRLEPPGISILSGRSGGIDDVAPKEHTEIWYYLPRYADIKEAGKYRVAINNDLKIYLGKKWRRDRSGYVRIKSDKKMARMMTKMYGFKRYKKLLISRRELDISFVVVD